jgi:hypothetical protein
MCEVFIQIEISKASEAEPHKLFFEHLFSTFTASFLQLEHKTEITKSTSYVVEHYTSKHYFQVCTIYTLGTMLQHKNLASDSLIRQSNSGGLISLHQSYP